MNKAEAIAHQVWRNMTETFHLDGDSQAVPETSGPISADRNIFQDVEAVPKAQQSQSTARQVGPATDPDPSKEINSAAEEAPDLSKEVNFAVHEVCRPSRLNTMGPPLVSKC